VITANAQVTKKQPQMLRPPRRTQHDSFCMEGSGDCLGDRYVAPMPDNLAVTTALVGYK
jgi:hypothetical protein